MKNVRPRHRRQRPRVEPGQGSGTTPAATASGKGRLEPGTGSTASRSERHGAGAVAARAEDTTDSAAVLLDFAPPRSSPSSLLLSSKAGEVLGLTPSNCGHGAAEVPSTYSSSCPAFVSAAPMGSRMGSVRSFSGTKTLLTIRLEVHCPSEGFFWPSLSLD